MPSISRLIQNNLNYLCIIQSYCYCSRRFNCALACIVWEYIFVIKVEYLPVLFYGTKMCLVKLTDDRFSEFTWKLLMIKWFGSYNNSMLIAI